MKEIKQQNIVNFVDSFLVGETELWVSETCVWCMCVSEWCKSTLYVCVCMCVCVGGDGVPSWRIAHRCGDRDCHERESNRSCVSRG